MNRWNARLFVALVAAAGLAGCGQKIYMSPSDAEAHHLANELGLPPSLENNPHASIIPGTRTTPAPMDINNTDRPIRYMCLAEAIAIALEQGNVGSQSSLFPGIVNDNLLQFNGRFVGASDSIRVLALDPAVSGADIDASLSKFDMRFVTSMSWTKRDDAVGNVLQSFQNGDNAAFSTGLYKFLPTGGVTGITFNTDYNLLSVPPTNQVFTNPAYKPRAQVTFEQPLLQGMGVEINQLAVSHPGALTLSGVRSPGGGRVEGVLISRLRYDQSRVEFERNVNFMLLNVEYAYWNLYGSYFTLFSREQGMRQAFEAWKINKARFDVGALKQQDLEQTRAQYELFRSQRITAMGQVLDKERQLRGLLGLPIEDGKRIVPSDVPTLAEFKPDWTASLTESLSYRPELILARQDLKFRQLDLILQKNFLKPDLRFFANYDMNGIGQKLDGSAVAGFSTDPNTGAQTPIPGNALASLADNEFNSWTVGLRLDVPIGFRDAHAQVRVARLNLARSYYQLKDQERKAEALLAVAYRELAEYYATIQANRAQREANARQLELRFQEYRVGRGTLDVLLEAQRNFADSLATEYTAIVNYNNRLCGFQFAKGTLMAYDNVQVADGPLPAAAQIRAVEHQRQRAMALELRERPMLPAMPGGPTAHDGMIGNMPALSDLQVGQPTNSAYPPAEQQPAVIPLPAPTIVPAQPQQ